MRNFIDLHTHSTCSDGSFTPKELIKLADESGLYAVALTDHDNIDGLQDASEEAKRRDLIFIPGIELSCDFDSELHIVGLNVNPLSEKLIEATEKFKADRMKRNINTINRLNDMGINISLSDAQKHCGGSALGRAHIAMAMIEKGYVNDTKEAFREYLGKGKPGYSRELRISVYDAINLIKDVGGISILAHCHYLNMADNEFIEFVTNLKANGLNGLEGYYTEYTDKQSEFYISVAQKLGLIISGGSDFHGKLKPEINIGSGFGNLKIPKSLLDKIINTNNQ